MIDLRALLAVAGAELRRTRRLVRYWVFVVLALLIPVASFLWHGLAIHRFVSTMAASFAMINPRYFTSSYGLTFLLVYLLGVIFLGFDVRSRDVRAGVAEVLDARPVGNLELLGGRFVGLLVASWVPLVALVVLLQLVGLAVGVTMEGASLVVLLTVEAIPALAKVIAAVFLVTLLVRNRLAAALILLAVWGVLFSTISGWIPVTLGQSPLVDVTGWTVMPFPSDLTSGMPDAMAWLHRGGQLLAGLALLLLAAVVHPRRDGRPRPRRAGIAIVGLLVGAAMVAGPYLRNARMIDRFRAYQAAHARAAEPVRFDLTEVAGTVRVDPGSRLDMDLRLTLVAQGDGPVSSLQLSLNPGFDVEAVSAGGDELRTIFREGLLEADLPQPVGPGGEPLTVSLQATGKPDPNFAYLDASRHLLDLPVSSGMIFLFGFEPVFFERGYVALMPGAHWLPSVGSALEEQGEGRAEDPFLADLTVEVPRGWRVAGPGRPRPADAPSADRRAVRFEPGAPISRAALITAPFEVYEAEVEGVALRLLVDPSHADDLAPLARGGPELVDRIGERLKEAAAIGLPYPYDGLTMVEVPNALRSYGGGWREDTTLAQPGLVLVRESGLPTARWDVRFGEDFDPGEREGGAAGAIADGVERFFSGDISGGDPRVCAARSFCDTTIGWSGPAAPALDYVTESLSAWLVAERRSYFSARMFEGTEMQETLGELLPRFFMSGGDDLAAAMIDHVSSRPGVWNALEAAPLAELNTADDPRRALDALVLKGGAMVRSLSEAFEREQLGQLLGELRERYAGRKVTRKELESTAADLGLPLDRWLEVWLDRVELPAFAVEQARVFRIGDAADGTPRYQYLVRLRNDGPVPGVVGLAPVVAQDDGGFRRLELEPHVIEAEQAVEIGSVQRAPVERLRVEPYLAENRAAFFVEPEEAPEDGDAEPWDGLRVVDYAPPPTRGVVVDDLDPGFEAVSESGEAWARVGGGEADERELDAGLPSLALGPAPSDWHRLSVDGAWGRYRHTAAVVRTGNPEVQARFSGELPRAGAWYLEVHRPAGLGRHLFNFGSGDWAELTVTVEAGGRKRETRWDAAAVQNGWSRVERFEMPAGRFRVSLAPHTEDVGLIGADAVRWVPAAPAGGEGEGETG